MEAEEIRQKIYSLFPFCKVDVLRTQMKDIFSVNVTWYCKGERQTLSCAIHTKNQLPEPGAVQRLCELVCEKVARILAQAGEE